MRCGVSRNKMVTFDTRQRISRVFPIRLPRLSRKAANFVEFSLRDSLLSFLVFSEYLGRFGSETKIVWVARICQNMSHLFSLWRYFPKAFGQLEEKLNSHFCFSGDQRPSVIVNRHSVRSTFICSFHRSQVINCSPTEFAAKYFFRQYAANRQQSHHLVTLIYACCG